MTRFGRDAAAIVSAALLLTVCTGDQGDRRAHDRRPLAAWPTTVEPPASPACRADDIVCVDETIAEMQSRLTLLAPECDHNAVFALVYLRITEEYRSTSAEPGAFESPEFVNRLDTVFARFYFVAFDTYAGGDLDAVAPAWRIAFDQAVAGRISGLGDAMLAMNAHINRDLPFVLAQVGVVGPDGRSRKNDFDRVDSVFARAFLPVVAEVTHRFDPAFAQPELAGVPLDLTGAADLIRSWRNAAFRNAERLVAAPPERRPAVAAEIEDNAAVIARSLQLATTLPAGETSAARDEYCRTRHD